MVLRLSLLIFIIFHNRSHGLPKTVRRAPSPPPFLVGDWRFQTTKNNAKETLPKKHLFYQNYIKLVRAKKKINIFLLFP